jgi:hypothetical protein
MTGAHQRVVGAQQFKHREGFRLSGELAMLA